MDRPAVDVVVPHAGADTSELRDRFARALTLRDADALTVVPDPGRTGSYTTRNRGAREGSAPWILFLDDDVEPQPGLLDALFDPPPGERTGVLAGGLRVAPGRSAAARFAAARGGTETGPMQA